METLRRKAYARFLRLLAGSENSLLKAGYFSRESGRVKIRACLISSEVMLACCNGISNPVRPGFKTGIADDIADAPFNRTLTCGPSTRISNSLEPVAGTLIPLTG
jgi:hypothetical protein